MSEKAQTANKDLVQNIVSRLSKMQRQILAYLATTPQPVGGRIGALPRTGNIIDALCLARTESNYAVVSRALKRLEERGLVSSYSSIMAARGCGLAYALTAGEPCTGRGVAQYRLSRPKPRPPRHIRTIDL